MGQLVVDAETTAAANAAAVGAASRRYTLRDMVLPGTHDSASGTIGSCRPFSAAGRTQNLSVGQQLEVGVRYLDVRVATASAGGDHLSIWHGCLEGGNFEDVLEEVSHFVQNHTKEVIILELVPEFGKKFSAEEKRHCFDVAHEILTVDNIIPGDQLREIIENKPFVEVAVQKQRVVVLLHDRFFEGDGVGMTEDEITAKYGFAQSNQFLRNPWNNTRNRQELMNKNLTTVQESDNPRGQLLSNQFVATPGVSGAPDIVRLVCGMNSLRPVSYACHLYEPGALDRFFFQNADKDWNIVAMDFVDLCPEITDFLISLNWKHIQHMKILLAAVYVDGKDHDVTDKVQSFLCREAIVFLVDPEVDLGMEAKQFTLSVAYSLSSSDDNTTVRRFVTTVDVDCDCSIIISPFCANEGSVRVEVTDDNGATGVVHRGKLYSTRAEIPSGLSGTAFEYNIDAVHCDFSIA